MNKASGAVFGLIGAILLLLPVAAFAGPQLPGEPTGSHTFCAGFSTNNRSVTMTSALGRVQPIRAHGTCHETLSIADTRVNITIIGDGGDTITWGSACADPNNPKLIGEDPSQAQIIQVRGRNITITGIEVSGQVITSLTTSFLNNNLGLFSGTDFTAGACVSGLASSTDCNNNRGIRAQRGGILLLGRSLAFGGFVAVPTAGNHSPAQFEEKTGVCIHDVSRNGIEIAAGSSARILNSDVHPVGRVVGNTISGNQTSGINVTRGGSADVADNVLNANSQFGIAINDNSQVNMGTTGNAACGLTVPGFANIKPPSIGGGAGAATPSSAGNQCPGAGGGLQNSGTAGSGVVNQSNLANSVTVANGSGGISCVRSYIAGRSTQSRALQGAGVNSLSGNATNVFTTCTSNLN